MDRCVLFIVSVRIAWRLLVLAAPAYAQQAQPRPGQRRNHRLHRLPARHAARARGHQRHHRRIGDHGRPSRSRLGLPLNVTLRRVEIKYAPDWAPLIVCERRDAQRRGSHGADDLHGRHRRHRRSNRAGTRSPHPTDLAAHARARQPALWRLRWLRRARTTAGWATAAGTELPAYILPHGQIGIRIVAARTERMQVGGIRLRRAALRAAVRQSRRQSAVNLTTTDGRRASYVSTIRRRGSTSSARTSRRRRRARRCTRRRATRR